MIFKRKPRYGEMPLSDVATPVVGDAVMVVAGEREGTGQVVRAHGGHLGVRMDAWVPDAPSFGVTYLDRQVKVRWREQGARRLLETRANVVDPSGSEAGLLWVADLGRWTRRDRRAFVRAEIRAAASLEPIGGGDLLACQTVNISENSLEADLDESRDLARGTAIRMSCVLDDTPFVFRGEVLGMRAQRVVLHFPNLLATTRDELRAKVIAASARSAA